MFKIPMWLAKLLRFLRVTVTIVDLVECKICGREIERDLPRMKQHILFFHPEVWDDVNEYNQTVTDNSNAA